MTLGSGEIAYHNKEKNARLELAYKAGAEANATSRTTSGQLLLIAGAILTFSSAALSNTSSMVKLPNSWKWWVVASWILFAVSALISVISLIADYRFFIAWNSYHMAVAKKIAEGATPGEAAEALKEEKPDDTTSMRPVYVQTILIFVGLGVLLVAIARSLFIAS